MKYRITVAVEIEMHPLEKLEIRKDVSRKLPAHQFVGRIDRYCDLCDEPDRHENHRVPREKLKTVEERAKRIVNELIAHNESLASALGHVAEGVVVGPEVVHATLVSLARRHLLDQIEDCAKILDQHEKERSDICSKADKGGFADAAKGYALQAVALMRAATEIRALAAPTEQTEGKGIER